MYQPTNSVDQLDPNSAVPIGRLQDKRPVFPLHGSLQLLPVLRQDEGLAVEPKLPPAPGVSEVSVTPPETVLPTNREQARELVYLH